jgi:alpha-1,2-glucosyltransferase
MNTQSILSEKRWLVWQALALLLLVTILLFEFWFMSGVKLLSDEGFNFRQITRFVKGDFSMEPGINMIPGYHAVVAIAMRAFQKEGPFSARFISVWISILSVVVFCLLSWKLYQRPSLTRTFQYAFFPLLFPFFALIYTDILALLLVLLAFYLILWKRYTLAGLVGILSVLARTNNITWFAFLYVMVYYENYRLDWRSFPKSLRQTWVYWVGFGLFLIFLIANQGIAITDKSVQPSFQFQTGNVFFLLFLFFFLFLPLNIANFPTIVQFIRQHIWLFLAIIAGVGLLYFLTFENTHPYNQVYPNYYLRNKLLMHVTASLVLKSLFFLPVVYGLLSLAVTTLTEKRFYWLYPFAVLSLVPFWLIEPRYFFVPLSLFILFKTERARWVEWLTIGIYMLLSVIFLFFTHNREFFI